ncbi:aquaporin-like protein [Chytriomyces cf. hyalinus JEL632]|nr:aquaporin-like protein [Chytriomyces cf. hyalinus JEL632]
MQRSRVGKLALQAATEWLGMFLFIFIALGGVQSALKTNAADLATDPTLAFVEISLCFGFGLATAIFFCYRISGGALNPAVNFGLLVAGVMDVKTAFVYTVAQLLGATVACGAVSAIFPGDFAGANQVFDGVGTIQAFLLEAILTFGLVLTVLFLAVEKSRITFLAPLIIGIYVFIAHLLAIPYTNTSINPARSFGASVVSGSWKDHWVFWVGPLSGGYVAGLVYRLYMIADYTELNAGQDADSQ